MYKVKRESGKVQVHDQSRRPSDEYEEIPAVFEADEDSYIIVQGQPRKLSEVDNLTLLRVLAEKGKIT